MLWCVCGSEAGVIVWVGGVQREWTAQIGAPDAAVHVGPGPALPVVFERAGQPITAPSQTEPPSSCSDRNSLCVLTGRDRVDSALLPGSMQ